MKFLVVGCGISGAALARSLAEKGHEVRVIDQKSHIGGNCYDYFDENGINVHLYGTHIFHTDNKQVWDFLSRYTHWYPFQHKVKALIDGMEVPIPFNLNSIQQVFPEKIANNLEDKLIKKYGFNVKVPILKLRNTDDRDLLFLAEYIYEKVFLHYTMKQWGLSFDDLGPAVTERVPVYISRDNRYFQNKYQGIPLQGYSAMIKKMIAHKNIEVHLQSPFSIQMTQDFDHVFYSGAIDEFFNYEYGELPYRSLKFEFLTLDREYFQSTSVVNYPCDYDFTRIGEYKYFLGTKSKKTVVSFEYPQPFNKDQNERYYPIIKQENLNLYQMYLNKSKQYEKFTFFGRLGDYRYYDMDKAVNRALELANRL